MRIPVVLLCAASLAACTPGATPASGPPVSAKPVSALACPKAVPTDPGIGPWVPAVPRGLDGSARMAPQRVPARVVVCAYIGPRSPAGTSGSVLLSGDLSGVMGDLAWVPPTRRQGVCAAYVGPTDGDYYLIGINYPGSAQWVAAPANHCAGSSNGVFSSAENQSGRALAWFKAQHWTPTSGSNDACRSTGNGRLGQQSSMVPDHPVSVSVCDVIAADGGKATQRAETSGVDALASALNAQPASPSTGFCRPAGSPFGYKVLFAYAQGPPVVVSVASCVPGVDNGSLQSNLAAVVLPLIRQLIIKH